MESQSRGPQCGLGALSAALSLPASEPPLALGEPRTCHGAPLPRASVPTVHFQKPGACQFHKEIAGRPTASVTGDWIAGERDPLCVLSMKNTPFRERIQLVFHRERRQPRWKKKSENNADLSLDFLLNIKAG